MAMYSQIELLLDLVLDLLLELWLGMSLNLFLSLVLAFDVATLFTFVVPFCLIGRLTFPDYGENILADKPMLEIRPIWG